MAKPTKEAAAAAKLLGRLGGLKGGRQGGIVRMASLTKAEKSALGRKAIRARWAKAKKRKAKK